MRQARSGGLGELLSQPRGTGQQPPRCVLPDLSQGMQKCSAIARAFALKPKMLVARRNPSAARLTPAWNSKKSSWRSVRDKRHTVDGHLMKFDEPYS